MALCSFNGLLGDRVQSAMVMILRLSTFMNLFLKSWVEANILFKNKKLRRCLKSTYVEAREIKTRKTWVQSEFRLIFQSTNKAGEKIWSRGISSKFGYVNLVDFSCILFFMIIWWILVNWKQYAFDNKIFRYICLQDLQRSRKPCPDFETRFCCLVSKAHNRSKRAPIFLTSNAPIKRYPDSITSLRLTKLHRFYCFATQLI